MKSPEPHVNGEDLLHIVCCQFILIVWVVDVLYTHHTAESVDLD